MSVYSYDVEKLSIAIYTWPSSMMEGFPPVPISRRRFVQSPAYKLDFVHSSSVGQRVQKPGVYCGRDFFIVGAWRRR